MYEFLGPNIHLTGLLPVLLCVCGLKESVSDLWRYKCHPTKHLFIIWIEKSMERETLKAVTPICGHLNRETTFDTTWCLYCEQFKIQFFSFKSKSRILKLKSRYFAYKESPRGATSGMSRCHFLGDFSCLSWASIMCNQAEILICWSLTLLQ